MKKLLIIFMVLFFIMGCTEEESKDPAPNWDITGTWDVDFSGASVATTGVVNITQSGSELNGTMTNSMSMDFDIDGRVTGDNIYLTLIETPATGYRVTVSMSTDDGVTAFGTWSDNMGQNGTCAGGMR